jgi:hypothetical protein
VHAEKEQGKEVVQADEDGDAGEEDWAEDVQEDRQAKKARREEVLLDGAFADL